MFRMLLLATLVCLLAGGCVPSGPKGDRSQPRAAFGEGFRGGAVEETARELKAAHMQFSNFHHTFLALSNNLPASQASLINMANISRKNAELSKRIRDSLGGADFEYRLKQYLLEVEPTVDFASLQMNTAPDMQARVPMANFQQYTLQLAQRIRKLRSGNR